jgi:16S rRNA (guanine527-N7)-methyltransferase
MTPESIECLIKGAESFGIKLTKPKIELFCLYHQKLIEWNSKMNLTAITDEREIVIKHFIDSLSVVNHLPDGTENLIDVGTGAGFPGIPIKIVKEDITVTLLDSLKKRVIFLDNLINEFHFTGIKAIHHRAEDLARDAQHREHYDVGIARAVAPLPVLCEYILPFVRVGGLFMAMKGKNIQDELDASTKAVSVLGGNIISNKNFLLPFEEIERNIVFIEKIRHTPTKYPRKSGKPSRTPIK